MKKSFFRGIIIILIAVSCSKDNTLIKDASVLSLKGKSLNIFPTKTNIPLEAGKKIGVYVVNVTSGLSETLSTSIINNRLFSVQTGGLITGDVIYLNVGNDYDVYAYSPIVNDQPLDPNSLPFLHGTDLLYADVNRSLRNVLIGENTVDLIFVHKMSQIKFALIDDRDEITKILYPFSGAHFEVTGFYKDFTLNLANGTISIGVIDNTIKITDQNSPVCFVPALEDMILTIKVTIPGATSGEQILTGVITKSFISGNSYSYNIKISTTTLNITGSVIDWITVPTDDVVVK